jgi:hypothetical protein
MVSLTQLGIANQQLNTTVIILDSRRSPRISDSRTLSVPLATERMSPPGYEESQMIAAARQRNLRKRASALELTGQTAVTVDSGPRLNHSSSIPEMPTDGPENAIVGVAELPSDCVLDKSSADSSLVVSLHNEDHFDSRAYSQSPRLGRARSRRWLELHCN